MVIFGWLARIGLEHAVPMFQAEGVTSPAALANLKTEDYDRLGINNDDEKRRLSELVGRVRQVGSVTTKRAVCACSLVIAHFRPPTFTLHPLRSFRSAGFCLEEPPIHCTVGALSPAVRGVGFGPFTAHHFDCECERPCARSRACLGARR